jgi:putative nucleotidyltransferase with HDIG domain
MDQHIADLLIHPKVLETREHMHHSIPKHDHLLRSVKYSYRIARLLRADQRICVRAAIVHDIDSRQGTLTTHGAVAARWAAEQGEPEEVCKAIVSHMYPFGPAPTTREGWVLVLADKAASLGDLKQFVRGLLDGTSLETRRRLRESDPYYRSQPRRLPLRHRLRRRRVAQI